MREIILASGSPRRRELLETAGIAFEVKTADADESTDLTDPEAVVLELSARKSEAVLKQLPAGRIVLGADTIVTLDGEILGKPADAEDACRMLRRLRGRAHEVFTGVTLCEQTPDGRFIRRQAAERTLVQIAPLTEAEITAYVQTGEPLDKAGAYGIQGIFSRHVARIEGDYFNVVGLPVHIVYRMLKDWGVKETLSSAFP